MPSASVSVGMMLPFVVFAYCIVYTARMSQVDNFSKEVLSGQFEKRVIVVNELVNNPSLYFPDNAVIYDRGTQAPYVVSGGAYVPVRGLPTQVGTNSDLPGGAAEGAFAFVRSPAGIWRREGGVWVEYVDFTASGIPIGQKGVAGGVASLNADGRVPHDVIGLAPVYNVKQYGAVGDGVANDTAALQAGLAAAAAAGGGIVYLPTGTYLVDGQLEIPSRTTLCGAGMGQSTIRAVAGTVFPKVAATSYPGYLGRHEMRYLIATASRGRATARAEYVQLRDLTVDWNHCPADDGEGTDMDVNAGSPAPIWIDYADYVTVRNVDVLNGLETNLLLTESDRTTSPNYNGTNFSVSQSRHVHVQNLHVGSSQYRSIEVKYNSQDVTFIDCVVKTANPWRHSLEVFSGAGRDPDEWARETMGPVRFIGCTFHALNWPGEDASRQFDIFSLHGPINVLIDSCHFKVDSHKWGFVGLKIFDKAENITVTNNTFDFRGVYDISTGTWARVSNAEAVTNARNARPIQIGDVGDISESRCLNIVVANNNCITYSDSADGTISWFIDNPNGVLHRGVVVTGNQFLLRGGEVTRPLVRLAGNGHTFTGNNLIVEETSSVSDLQWLRLRTDTALAQYFVEGNYAKVVGATWDADGGIEYADSSKVEVYDNSVWDTGGRILAKTTRPFGESGTFVPELEGTTGNPSSVTYGASNAGYWYRVGNLVHLYVYLDVDAYSGGSGQFRIGNLPFAPNMRGAGMGVIRADGITYSGTLAFLIEGTAAKILARDITSAGSSSVLNLSAFSSACKVGVTGTYVIG